MTVIEKASKLKRLANKNVAIFCESMSEDKELYEMASKHFGNNIDEVDFKDDSAYIVTDIDNKGLDLVFLDKKDRSNYSLVPYDEFFED